MRILMVNKFLYPRGGAESYMLKLGEALSDCGHDVQYFGMYDEKNTVGNSLGLYTQSVDFHSDSLSRFSYPFKIIFSFEAKRKIAKILDGFKPDIVHMNNINFQITPSIIYEIKKRNIPIVQTVHDYQMICPNHLLYDFEENMPCTRCIVGSRFNCLKHKCIHQSRAKSLIGSVEGMLYSWLKTYKMVDLYICPSRFLEGKLLEASDVFRGRTYVIHNFIKLPRCQGTHEDCEPYILFAGRFSKEKGIGLLAETAKLLPEIKFAAAGSGPDENLLRGIPNIELKGFLTGEEFDSLLSEAEAVIVPSVCFENCSLTILEAHSMGVPVITMNSGGMAELVSDGKTGVLINEPTPAAAAAAIKKLTENPQLYRTIKENCIKSAADILTAEKYCGILTEKYSGLIAKR